MAQAQWQQVSPNFSRGITTAMSNAQQGIADVGRVAGDYLLRAKEEERYKAEQARLDKQESRQKVLDDRATQLWTEQQAEKDALANAGKILAVEKDTAAASSKDFGDAMNWVQANNLDTDTLAKMGVQGSAGLLQAYRSQQAPQQGVNINAGVPNVGGSAGGAIMKTVARQVPISQPAAATPKPKSNGITMSTDGFMNANDVNANDVNAKGMPAGSGFQYVDSPYNDTRTTKPSMSLSYTPSAEAKSDKILTPTTPKQAQESKKHVTTVMDKVVAGYRAGTPPKLNQIEAATIDKIFATVNPNAVDRQTAKADLDSMLFSLGLNPKQVKEYSDIGVESVYGDANDPVKMALANAKLSAYQANVESGNKLGAELMKENRADARQERSESRADARAAKSDKVLKMDPITEYRMKLLTKDQVEGTSEAAKEKRVLAEQEAYKSYVETVGPLTRKYSFNQWKDAGKPGFSSSY